LMKIKLAPHLPALCAAVNSVAIPFLMKPRLLEIVGKYKASCWLQL
jgi:hypothetical protein